MSKMSFFFRPYNEIQWSPQLFGNQHFFKNINLYVVWFSTKERKSFSFEMTSERINDESDDLFGEGVG